MGSLSFQVAWICASSIETSAATALLKQEHEVPGDPPEGEQNTYTFGRVGEYNVIITTPPIEAHGTTSASQVVLSMRRRFPALKLVVIGICCGRCDLGKPDIRLGDVVVSSPQTRGAMPYNSSRAAPDIRIGDIREPSDQRFRHDLGERFPEPLNPFMRTTEKQQKRTMTEEVISKTRLQRCLTRQDGECCSIHCENHLKDGDPSRHVAIATTWSGLPALIIKNRCDYADTNKDEQNVGFNCVLAYTKELLGIVSSRMSSATHASDMYAILLDSAKEIHGRSHYQQPHHKEEDKDKEKFGFVDKRPIPCATISEAYDWHGPWNRVNQNDWVKLGLAYAVSGCLYVLAPEMLLKKGCSFWPSILNSNTENEKPDDHPIHWWTYLATFAILLVSYWSIWISLVRHNTNGQRRVLYCFSTYAAVILVGVSMRYDLALLTMIVLPAAMNVALTCCFVEKSLGRHE